MVLIIFLSENDNLHFIEQSLKEEIKINTQSADSEKENTSIETKTNQQAGDKVLLKATYYFSPLKIEKANDKIYQSTLKIFPQVLKAKAILSTQFDET